MSSALSGTWSAMTLMSTAVMAVVAFLASVALNTPVTTNSSSLTAEFGAPDAGVEGVVGGPLGARGWTYSVGGFYRHAEGHRPADG
ncbi:MAG: hypothetical protein ACKOTF_08015, partial [Opitutaceae bacterium]